LRQEEAGLSDRIAQDMDNHAALDFVERVRNKPLRFGFVLLPDFTLLSLSGFVEVLRVFCDEATRHTSQQCRWTLLADDHADLKSSGGLDVGPLQPISNPKEFDYIVLVGGKRPQAEPLANSITAFLKEADRQKITIVSISAATFSLARTGMLEGKSICVHWDQVREFNIEFPELATRSDIIFLVDDNRITCAGGTYVIDLAVHILVNHFGKNAMRMTLALMGLQSTRQPTHFQEHLAKGKYSAGEARMSKLVRLLETRTDQPPTMAELARYLHVSPRHLARLVRQAFNISPQELSKKLRLRRAHWLMQNSGRSVSNIAYECGFSDSSHLAKVFKREFGCTPSSVRHAPSAAIDTDLLSNMLRRWETH
jgi:transcriptional regulator GlxA family with amidase domain